MFSIQLGLPDSSVGLKKKKTVCNAGDPGSIPDQYLGCKDPLEKGKATHPSLPTHQVFLGFPCGSAGKGYICEEVHFIF